MELGQYLTPQMVNKLHTDIMNIRTILTESGYDLKTLYDFDEVSVLYSPDLMLKLFNDIENTLNEIDECVDWVNPYSAKKIWKKQNGILYSGVKRWFDWAEFNLDVVNKFTQKTVYLQTTEYGIIEDLYDENGEKIIGLNGYFEPLPKKEGV